MSRKGSLNKIFESESDFSIQHIKASGDCLYDCIIEAFRSVDRNVLESPLLQHESDDGPILALRRTVSQAVTQDIFETFKQFHEAGLPDFGFMRRCREKNSLQDLLLVCGKGGAGAGQCIWANEFEIGVLAERLNLAFLILDMQARELSSRFISVLSPSSSSSSMSKATTTTSSPCEYVILQRTRREHYNLIKHNKKGLLKYQDLPEEVIVKWKVKE